MTITSNNPFYSINNTLYYFKEAAKGEIAYTFIIQLNEVAENVLCYS